MTQVTFGGDHPTPTVDDTDNGNEQPFVFGPQESIREMDTAAVLERTKEMFREMDLDREKLDYYAEYARGNQSDPHLPNYADPTTHELAKRSTLNLMTLAINLPAQTATSTATPARTICTRLNGRCGKTRTWTPSRLACSWLL